MLIKKFYEYIKEFIIENYLFLLFFIVLATVLTYPLPYYIYTSGGLINVNNKIKFDEKTESSGSYNMCYVSQIKATVPTYFISFIMKNWDVEKIKNVAIDDKETDKDILLRDKIYLNTGNNSAVINAFKYANKDINIVSVHPIVVYVMEEANSDIQIGDEIISIDNIEVNDKEDITTIIKNFDVSKEVSIKVINNNKEYLRYANIFMENDKKLIGVAVENKVSLDTDPKINFKFSRNEAGPSGGLIITLALYDYLVDEDITKGLKISGTGTIDDDGNIGSIGGVKYKLAGAVKKKADVFFVPNGENYEEAIKLKKEKKYKIDIIGVSTFEEAINYLKNNYGFS